MKNRGTFKINQHLKNSICFYLIHSDDFIKKVRSVLDPKLFIRDEITRTVVNMCYSFYDEAGAAPKDHIWDELDILAKNYNWSKRDPDNRKEMLKLYLDQLIRKEEGEYINENYVLSKLNEFILYNEFDTAGIKFGLMLEAGNYKKAREYMMKVLKSGIPEFNIGQEWTDVNRIPSYLQSNRIEKLIPVGLEPIDDKYPRGICRTDLVCLLAPYKGKKSYYLHDLGLGGVNMGWNVLHITHENSIEETEERYDSINAHMTTYQESQLVTLVDRDENGVVIDLYEQEIPSIYQNQENVLREKRGLLRQGSGKLMIKDYPPGVCTVSEIERLLDTLEMEGFIPDIIINDYVEQMYINNSNSAGRHNAIADVYKDLKALAVTRRAAVLTASQVTSENQNRIIKSPSAVAEARSKAGIVNLMIALSQNEEMKKYDISVAYVIANRNGPQYYGCCFDSAIAAGEVVRHCWPFKE